ncbi:MAG TPA: SDR family oxidoreductase [Acidimicrobiales bacterium]|nr:SDR family oxidoreductase [Acidimicrobiales bacterium]
MTSALDLSGELVLISGAAGGLGRPICERLAGLGALVAAVDLRPPEVAGEPAAGISWYRADAGDENEVEALLDDVAGRHGRLPSVVCCHAGVVRAHPILDFPLEDFDEVMRTNVRAAFVLAKGAARRWRDGAVPGHLIFTSSWVKDFPWPEIAPYSASKAALWSLTRSFAKELAPYGIRANAVLPGIVSVGMARRQWDEDEVYRRRASAVIALGEQQDPASVADAFAFLCSPLASYMTGSALRVDGGCSLLGVD